LIADSLLLSEGQAFDTMGSLISGDEGLSNRKMRSMKSWVKKDYQNF